MKFTNMTPRNMHLNDAGQTVFETTVLQKTVHRAKHRL